MVGIVVIPLTGVRRMPHDKRNCRKSSRKPGLADSKNYHSPRAMQRALRRQQLAKASRRINRRRK